MRIAHVITRLIIGGAQENTVASVLGLNQKKNISIRLYSGPTTGPEGSLESKFKDSSDIFHIVPNLIRPINPLNDYIAYRHLIKEFKSFKPDIVHTHSGKAGFLGRLAASKANVKNIIHSIHGPSFGTYQGWIANTLFRKAEKIAATHTDHYITVANAMEEQYLKAGIGNPNIFTKIYSGFNLRPFIQNQETAEIRNQFGIKQDHLVVAKIARLFDLKGHNSLFEIAPNLIKKIPNIRFLLIGDGPLKKDFKQIIKNINCEKNFIFAGLVDPLKIPQLVNSIDILVHLSRREGLPRALPQAMAASKPIVAFDYDGAREVCINEKTGLLVDQEDLSGLIKSISRLAKDKTLRKSLGNAGREFVKDKFTINRLVEDQYNLYEKLLSSR
mgnify:FL=1